MKPLLRMAALVVVGVLAVLLIGGVLVPWLGGPLFADGIGELCQILWTEQIHGDALNARNEAMQRCLQVKHEAAGDLCAGRLTLLEATERFRAAQRALEDGQDKVLGRFQTNSDKELTENVLRWVAASLRQEPNRQAEVLARLNKELQQVNQKNSL